MKANLMPRTTVTVVVGEYWNLDPVHCEQLVKTLEIPTNKLKHDQITASMGIIQKYSDVFALTDLELRCSY